MKYADRIALPPRERPGRRMDQALSEERARWRFVGQTDRHGQTINRQARRRDLARMLLGKAPLLDIWGNWKQRIKLRAHVKRARPQPVDPWVGWRERRRGSAP